MKLLIIAFLTLGSTSVYANCESLDLVVAKYKNGSADGLELSKAYRMSTGSDLRSKSILLY